jgi:hypothetical protein
MEPDIYIIVTGRLYISIEKLCNFEHQGACVDFIKIYNHYHAGCVNYQQNPYNLI